MTHPTANATRTGLTAALVAHLFWGVMPFYIMLVKAVPALEFVGWRAVFSVPFCLLFIHLRKQWPDLRAALTNWRVLRLLLVSALLVGSNWLIYVLAVQAGHVYAASFGYYVVPLVQVAAGTVLLGEKLSRLQWAAVALAAIGVLLLGWGELSMLGISLALAFTWAAYGLVRKFTPVGSLPGLTVETLILLPPALGVIAWYAASPQGSSLALGPGTMALVSLSGIMTAVPLTLFALAARQLDFTILGMVQFTSPTLVFVLGVLALGLPLQPAEVASFAIIWAAIALFLWDLFARRSASQAPA